MRRQKSLRIGVHNANAVVWRPVYRTHLNPRLVLHQQRGDLREGEEHVHGAADDDAVHDPRAAVRGRLFCLSRREEEGEGA
jgi:hypothetical protein|eukprot:30202-Pelagococcus_subviridis.AAC.4